MVLFLYSPLPTFSTASNVFKTEYIFFGFEYAICLANWLFLTDFEYVLSCHNFALRGKITVKPP